MDPSSVSYYLTHKQWTNNPTYVLNNLKGDVPRASLRVILLIRHGEYKNWDTEDSSLTICGMEQSKSTAKGS